MHSVSTASFCSTASKISRKKKAPQTQIFLVPVSLNPVSREASETGQTEYLLFDCESDQRSFRSENDEQPDFIKFDSEARSQAVDFSSHEGSDLGSEDVVAERHKPRQAFLGPPTGEVQSAPPAKPAPTRRFSVSQATNSWVNLRRSSDEQQDTHPDMVGHTLKDWFEATERDRTSSGQSSLRGPMKSPDSASSGRLEMETAEKRLARQAELKREAIRRELIRCVGGPLEAFRMIDLSGSGSISQTEFADGMHRIGIDWQELTNSSKILEVFRLFDRDKNGTISMEELFPEERYAVDGGDVSRMSTPEFWNQWCRKTAHSDRSRAPRWANSSDEEINATLQTQDYRQEITHERRRMQMQIRRMQKQGKSDARCRECVATHLPRGTGPKDRESVLTFSDAEVRACRRAYNETTSNHVRNISKNVYEMRESKRVLQGLRHKFSEQVLRSKNDAFEGLHLFGPHEPHSGDSPKSNGPIL